MTRDDSIAIHGDARMARRKPNPSQADAVGELYQPIPEPTGFKEWWALANRPYVWNSERYLAIHAWSAALSQAPRPESAMAERERCAAVCDDEARIRTEAGRCHAENSPERDRCFAGARAAINCAKGIRSGEVAPRPESPAVLALRELVACKDLKDEAQALNTSGDPHATVKRRVMLGEYERRKPLAWEAAHAALQSLPANGTGDDA